MHSRTRDLEDMMGERSKRSAIAFPSQSIYFEIRARNWIDNRCTTLLIATKERLYSLASLP